ncbi:Het-C-domain-containing protein [Lentinula aciculospora]|uniref:Het-C-domain-containing protein n=1 Tax=Lentinula aciculospora TaxID=153920 RepID=A0A9W9ANA0_9AGAR|nr:Het-C-domain-containing protein [Lentinula aciculospora]
MPTTSTTLLFLTVVFILLPSNVCAFGAGDIPDFAYLNDKAFRHGDIENILEQVLKNAARAAGGGGLLGFAKQAFQNANGGSKFDKGDIKKVYFGNWLRDYSQAMDIAGLSKLTAETLVLVVSVLGFMTFGFATEEFEVTADRLGVYLPVEHIDNPKGYAEKEGDARDFHPKLRPPVDPRELEIDPRNGMKNYMATEDQGWDSSTAHIRRTFRACIEYGRRAGGREGSDLWEAYRLLGTGLHTMEDLLAHSNWCELSLRKMGHSEVFCHVGENTDIDTPNGRAPPLVTGTFGSADFLHSLLGEATDHLSQASVTSLSQKMSDASNESNSSGNIENLRKIFSKLPIGGSDEKMNEAEQLQQESKAYNFNPDDIAPPDVQKQLLEMLVWRDGVFRWITKKIEMIPGLSSLLDELTNALNAYVYTVIAPWLTPILTQATSVLGEGSKAVIDTDDQYEVFDNPDASDPSHSLLSKDHFGLILNEPAGKVAQIVVVYSTELIVKAWADDNDPNQVIEQILEAFHHPYFADGRSSIQNEMFEEIKRWIGNLGPDEASETIQALTKDSVRNGKNKRLSDESESQAEAGYGTSQSQTQAAGTYGQNDGYDSRPGQQYSDPVGSGGRQQYGGYGLNQSEQNSYSSGQSDYGQPGGGSYDYSHEEQGSYGMEARTTSDRYESGGYQEDRHPTHRFQAEGTYGSQHPEQQSHNIRQTGDTYATNQYSDVSYSVEQEPPASHHGHRGHHHKSGRDERDARGGDRSFQNEAFQQSYEQRGDYGSGTPDDRRFAAGYGGREDLRQEPEIGRGYGEREGVYGRRDSESGHRHAGHSGHHGNHGSNRGHEGEQEDETFGAERLNIHDEHRERRRYY